MKKTKFTLLLLFFVKVGYSQIVYNSSINAILKMAQNYATPSHPLYNPAKALEIFTKGVEQGNARAMNGLGMLYNKGIGVEENHVQALQWFEKAAAKGYSAALYNAALMHKDGNGTTQDFKRAYEYYSQSAARGFTSGLYGQGYMLYKGLGVAQDYIKAFTLFKKGALLGSTGSMYMLGLCYRNGYGTALNIDSARYWLKKVAAKGDKRAIAELEEPEAENSFEKKSSNYKKDKAATKPNILAEEKTYRKIEQRTSETEMEGTYTGYIIRYDWSGKHVINKSQLTLKLIRMNNQLNGEWEEEDGNTTSFQARLTDSALIFNNSIINRKDHYHPDKKILFEFKDAHLQLVKNSDSVYLAGNLQLYSIEHREPERPMYISLVRKEERKGIPISNKTEKLQLREEVPVSVLPPPVISKFLAYPNPFEKNFTVSFTLLQESNVEAILTDMSGRIIFQEKWIKQAAGQITKDITVELPAGTYILKLNYQRQAIKTVLIKQ